MAQQLVKIAINGTRFGTFSEQHILDQVCVVPKMWQNVYYALDIWGNNLHPNLSFLSAWIVKQTIQSQSINTRTTANGGNGSIVRTRSGPFLVETNLGTWPELIRPVTLIQKR